MKKYVYLILAAVTLSSLMCAEHSLAQSCYGLGSPTPTPVLSSNIPICDTTYVSSTDESIGLQKLINTTVDKNLDGLITICISDQKEFGGNYLIQRDNVRLVGLGKSGPTMVYGNIIISNAKNVGISNIDSLSSRILLRDNAQLETVDNIHGIPKLDVVGMGAQIKSINNFTDTKSSFDSSIFDSSINIARGIVGTVSNLNVQVWVGSEAKVDGIYNLRGKVNADGTIETISNIDGPILVGSTANVLSMIDIKSHGMTVDGFVGSIDCAKFGSLTVNGRIGALRAFDTSMQFEQLDPRYLSAKNQILVSKTGKISIMLHGSLMTRNTPALQVLGSVGTISGLKIYNDTKVHDMFYVYGPAKSAMLVEGRIGALRRFSISAPNRTDLSGGLLDYLGTRSRTGDAITVNSSTGIGSLSNGVLLSSDKKWMVVNGNALSSPQQYNLGSVDSIVFGVQ